MTIGVLVTARLKSTRLPMKAIKPILGRPTICHKLDRLKQAKRPQKIVICTSPLAQDNPLEAIAAQEGVDCFRGDPDDVLLRLTEAARQFAIDVVVSTTADDVLTDPESLDQLVGFHIQQKNDFTDTEGLPFGAECFALSYPAMVRACEIKDAIDTEVWGGYFTQTGIFKTGTLHVTDPEIRCPDLRISVDTPEDFELVRRIFEALYVKGKVFSLRQIVRFYNEHPELAKINAHVIQKPPKPIRVKPHKEWVRCS